MIPIWSILKFRENFKASENVPWHFERIKFDFFIFKYFSEVLYAYKGRKMCDFAHCEIVCKLKRKHILVNKIKREAEKSKSLRTTLRT